MSSLTICRLAALSRLAVASRCHSSLVKTIKTCFTLVVYHRLSNPGLENSGVVARGVGEGCDEPSEPQVNAPLYYLSGFLTFGSTF